MLVPIYENIAIGRCRNALWLIDDFNIAMDMIMNPGKYMEEKTE